MTFGLDRSADPTRLRVLTLNLWGVYGDWPQRREVIATGIADLQPDLIAFIEAVKTPDDDQVAEILGAGYHVVHQANHRETDGRGAAIATRWAPTVTREVDLHVTRRT